MITSWKRGSLKYISYFRLTDRELIEGSQWQNQKMQVWFSQVIIDFLFFKISWWRWSLNESPLVNKRSWKRLIFAISITNMFKCHIFKDFKLSLSIDFCHLGSAIYFNNKEGGSHQASSFQCCSLRITTKKTTDFNDTPWFRTCLMWGMGSGQIGKKLPWFNWVLNIF